MTETQQESRGQGQSLVPVDLADEYLKAREFLTPQGLGLRKHRGEWLRYDGRVFRSWSQEELESDVIVYLRGTSARAKSEIYAKKIISQLAATCLIPGEVDLPARHDIGTWSAQPGIAVFQNGVLTLTDLRPETEIGLMPHSPMLVSRVLLPFEYDPSAACPLWERVLGQVLPDPESRQLLQEMFGYCLTADISQQKFFMLEGSGGNGKGVVTNMLTRLLGPENVSALPVNRLGAPHELDVTLGKLVNITSEMKEKDIPAEDLLKQFVAGDRLHFNPKYQKTFTAKPTAKLILSTNERPMFTDRSDGLWRRLIILLFPITVPETQRDVHLEEKLAVELPGILNWAIRGARALYGRGAFLEPRVSIEARLTFQRESNNARMFLEETCRVDREGEVDRKKLYQSYGAYCEENGVRPMRSTNFYKEVSRVFPVVHDSRPHGKDSSRPRVFKGITIISP
jgi:putative DNA primase/helicase